MDSISSRWHHKEIDVSFHRSHKPVFSSVDLRGPLCAEKPRKRRAEQGGSAGKKCQAPGSIEGKEKQGKTGQ